MSDEQMHDPLNFMRNLWGGMGFSLPGMVAPTFDIEELDKRIKDLKAVEGWLRMNLSMLQMTIQGLEMQRTTVSTVQNLGQMASEAARKMGEPMADASAKADPGAAFSGAAMWPWQMMQQLQEQMQQQAAQATAAATAGSAADAAAAAKK